MTRPPPTSTPFPTRRSSDLRASSPVEGVDLLPGGLVEDRVGVLSGVDLRDGLQRLEIDDADLGFPAVAGEAARSEEHTSELQSLRHLVCRLLLEKKKKKE